MLFRIHSNFKFLIYFDHIAGVPGTDHHSSPTTTTVGVMGQVTVETITTTQSAEMGCGCNCVR